MATAAGLDSRTIDRHEEPVRILLEALEFAIDAAREDVAPSREDLIRENEAIKNRLASWAEVARNMADDLEVDR